MNIEFISYTGRYPNLCSGELIIKANDRLYTLNSILSSGGSAYCTNDYNDIVITSGEWSIDKDNLPDELWVYVDDITRVVNENIPHGCCGGCI